MPVPALPQQNLLLSALPAAVFQRLLPHLILTPLRANQVMYERGDCLHYVYFPVNAIVMLLNALENGASTEISLVGNDGVVGFGLFMGGGLATHRAVVQSDGFAYRVQAAQLNEEFNRHGELMRLLLRYTQALLTQIAQTAVCNRHHSLYQRLCRWLLLSLDRLSGNELQMTQEAIAELLGVRREGVTAAAHKLQKLGVISYQRGHITVLDRTKLESLCCECYAVVRQESERLLNQSAARAKSDKQSRIDRCANFS